MKYVIKDKKRNEEFEVKDSTELMTAFQMLRRNEIQEIEDKVKEMATAMNFHVENRYRQAVDINVTLQWTIED